MPDLTKQKSHIQFTLNGEAAEVAFAPHKTLLEVLREDLGLMGTKHGCELGECGTCAVLVNGRAILSCLMLGLDAEGQEVKTIEGMAEGAELHPLQNTFADLGAAQCGYCSPGFLLVAGRVVEEESEPIARNNQGSTVRQSLPLHRLHKNLRSSGVGRRAHAWRRDGAAARERLWPRINSAADLRE